MIKNDKFIEMILNDSYISWLEEFMEKYKYEEVDDLYFVREWSRHMGAENKKMLGYLKRLFLEINNYYVRNNDVKKNIDLFYLKYRDKYFKIRYTGECYECSVLSKKDFLSSRKFNKLLVKNYGNSDDMVLNLVNGAEVDCILSALPSPMEEQFVSRNKMLLNARIWLGLGNLLDEMKQEKHIFQKLKEFVLRQILKKEMAKKGENA